MRDHRGRDTPLQVTQQPTAPVRSQHDQARTVLIRRTHDALPRRRSLHRDALRTEPRLLRQRCPVRGRPLRRPPDLGRLIRVEVLPISRRETHIRRLPHADHQRTSPRPELSAPPAELRCSANSVPSYANNTCPRGPPPSSAQHARAPQPMTTRPATAPTTAANTTLATPHRGTRPNPASAVAPHSTHKSPPRTSPHRSTTRSRSTTSHPCPHSNHPATHPPHAPGSAPP